MNNTRELAIWLFISYASRVFLPGRGLRNGWMYCILDGFVVALSVHWFFGWK